ncbi:MAG: porin [Pelagimonas sp.]|nr:porin [Pelagimonas sp.]
MKKILIASTALVGFAGAASADIALSASAEMGLMGGDTITVAAGVATKVTNVTQFHNDIDVTATMTGEADNGLTFGTALNLEDAGITTTAANDIAAWVAYGNMRLTIGETDGAFDAAMQEVNLVGGSIVDNETTHLGFNGNAGLDGTHDLVAHGGQLATFQYSASGFTGFLSVELDDTVKAGAAKAGDPIWGVGVRYDAELGGVDLGIGLGHQATNDADSVAATKDKRSTTGVSIDATFANGLSAALNYSTQKRDTWAKDQQHAAIGVGYTMNALSIGANYGAYTNLGGINKDTASGFGLAVNYDLGGGLVAQAGFGSSETKDNSTGIKTTGQNWSLGLAMSF